MSIKNGFDRFLHSRVGMDRPDSDLIDKAEKIQEEMSNRCREERIKFFMSLHPDIREDLMKHMRELAVKEAIEKLKGMSPQPTPEEQAFFQQVGMPGPFISHNNARLEYAELAKAHNDKACNEIVLEDIDG